MRKRDLRISRIRAVEREYRIAVIAAELLNQQLTSDPSFLDLDDLRFRDAAIHRQNLETTYCIRLFAEFETGLREAWRHAYGRPSHPKTSNLLEAIATRCAMPQPWFDQVDKVREYRNSLVHDESATGVMIPLGEAARRLCRFFSALPPDW